ncbi:xanthine dehydrogenase molybdopterin binding subunit [Bermanella marisrubri]|uniref:Xanthine dehydrogenase, molybdopterin binding subunit n=1 Tax=Bermanella marisrubri TaxID=207949 RepID=Q1N1R6_9GAMM|nr:xanthine dehydrogenase molybdopterin binding subunit [Bermanella marisrubri]EAT12215.1 xanthine dehydrogenase, molybdopterin binding subunit [Oceanobacter sp. RED65] [Bermanella marisrubri]QIZ83684.1 xanthine dehydrogenase molybdopterin binding subunit [Bermanella marisrubri]
MSFISSRLEPYEQRRKRPAKGKSGKSLAHESAEKHVTGEAVYVDDMPELAGTLHMAVAQSTEAHANIVSMDLTKVFQAQGVVDVITLDDVPGEADIGPVFKGDPLFADKKVEYVGQPLFAVVAQSLAQAKRATKLAEVEYEVLPSVLEIEQALEQNFFVRPSHSMQKGDFQTAYNKAPNRLENTVYVKGQEHFYLEGQVSYVVPTEDKGMKVYTSSQHPTEVQKLVAEVLDLPMNYISVEVRRMGGGFGGKETQAAPWACMASVAANKLKRPVKLRLPRQDDMVMTGKRHDFLNQYRVAFDESGKILATDIMVAGKCGYSPDLSDAIVDRAMFHSDNAYDLGDCQVVGHRCKTHTVSNTAFRGFGGPQGMTIAEYMVDDIARAVGKDPLEVRKLNLYQDGSSTHYGQVVENYHMRELIEQLEKDCDYQTRRQAITEFNKNHTYKKRGLALTPVKFGISFTVQFLNQAGALVHVYTDGSIHLNHGGTEMGQGLFTKVAQVVANEFDVDIDTVQVSSTNTEKVPNTSPTAASSGTDLNGKAAQNACLTIKQRLIDFASDYFKVEPSEIRFENNHVLIGSGDNLEEMTFQAFVELAYLNRISLSSTGYYSTPKIHYNREKADGRPFFYYAIGAACSEVEIDTLTGEYDVLSTNIIHDVGQSLNPAIDIGQIEGGFIQGMGWLTTEELNWDGHGRVTSNGPANYKIPTTMDMPKEFNVKLFDRINEEQTIYNSKAVGEPPLMLGMAVWLALRDAAASVADYKVNPPLNAPATPEQVLRAVQYCQRHLEGRAS